MMKRGNLARLVCIPAAVLCLALLACAPLFAEESNSEVYKKIVEKSKFGLSLSSEEARALRQAAEKWRVPEDVALKKLNKDFDTSERVARQKGLPSPSFKA